MVKEIVHDPVFLAMPSQKADISDRHTGRDLEDTLKAHAESCVGMAANMIGVSKSVIAVNSGFMIMLMYNPEIISRSGPFEAEEGCLSLSGIRKTTRYKDITVRYLDKSFRPHEQKFTGWTAQIIQHEVDHINGILI